MSASMIRHLGRRRLSLAARHRPPVGTADPGHRPQRLREVEPVSRPAPAGRRGARARHSVAGARRGPAVDAVGRSRDGVAGDAPRRPTGPGLAAQVAGEPPPWLRRRRVRLRRRSRLAAAVAAVVVGVLTRPRDQERGAVGGRHLAPIDNPGRAARRCRALTRARRRLGAPHAPSVDLRQHDDPLRRPEAGARDADAARADARLAVLRPVSHRFRTLRRGTRTSARVRRCWPTTAPTWRRRSRPQATGRRMASNAAPEWPPDRRRTPPPFYWRPADDGADGVSVLVRSATDSTLARE